jgi:hypothetical protein
MSKGYQKIWSDFPEFSESAASTRYPRETNAVPTRPGSVFTPVLRGVKDHEIDGIIGISFVGPRVDISAFLALDGS